MLMINTESLIQEHRHLFRAGAAPVNFYKNQILSYLQDAPVVAHVLGFVPDEILPEAGLISEPPSWVCDERFAWQLSLVHYVDRYNLRLPAEFVDHMQANNWRVPHWQQPQDRYLRVMNDFCTDFYGSNFE